MKELIFKLVLKKTNNTKIQFIRYIFVGGIAAVVNILTLFIFTDVVEINYLLANAIGFVFGLATNYALSKLFVFTTERKFNKIFEFLSYAIIGTIGLGFDTLFMWLGTSIMGLYYLFTKVISTGLVFIWNFVARKVMYIILEKMIKE